MPKKLAQPELNEEGLMYGNKDTDQKFPFNADWAGSVVVSQFNVEIMGSGTKAVDEGTRRTKPYRPAIFDKLVADKGFNDMQYLILHDPRG